MRVSPQPPIAYKISAMNIFYKMFYHVCLRGFKGKCFLLRNCWWTHLIIYIGGITSAKDIGRALEVGFDFIQPGRTLILDPEFPNKMKDGIEL